LKKKERKTMIRSESGTKLLNAPDLSVPFQISDFEVHGIGGGFVVVNHYGDNSLAAARVNIGVIGEDWMDIDSALLYLHRTADLTNTKCSTTGLPLSGAGILLYFVDKSLNTDANRKKLLKSLVYELQTFTKTKVLCLPANLTADDLIHMYKTNELIEIAKSDSEEKKAGSDSESDAEVSTFVPLSKTKKKSSFAVCTSSFDFPVPKALITEDAIRDNVAAKSAAHSSFGSIVTLTKAKQWTNARIVLLGVTPLSCELYQLLTRETDTVFLSDPDSSKYDIQYEKLSKTASKIPPRAFIPWEKARDLENNWDIIVFCSPVCPLLDASTIPTIRSKAIISVSDDFLPSDEEEREQVLLTLEKANVFEIADGMSDLGEIAKVYSLSGNSTLSFNDAFELGSQVMQKKLHLHGIVTSDDVTAKRKFHDLMLHALEEDENARLFGLGTVMHQSSDRMTDWIWVKASAMCPAFRALTSQNATVKPDGVNYLDMGAGAGAAARWICKQNKKIHVTCIDVCPKQSGENRSLSDEEGLGNQIDVVQGSYERLNSDYSNYFDGCMSQDAFIHAFVKQNAFSEALRVTKGGGWLLISDLMRGDGKDGNEEMEIFVKEHNITDWATPNDCCQMAREAGWAEVR
jgi:SAM-dependent methyltransferase